MKIAMLGDIALIGQFDLCTTHNVYERIEYLKSLLEGYDYIIANLESPLTLKKHTMIPKSVHLKSNLDNIDVLQYLGINAVSLANNHSCDFGKRGLEDTINVLESNGIEWYGVNGKTIDKTISFERFHVSGFCCLSANGTHYQRKNKNNGVNLLTPNNLESQIKQAEGRPVIISIHWGLEHTSYPAIEHINLIKSMTVNNQVVIHGHHPHQIQGVQKNNNSIIAYSLGNALFDNCVSLNGSIKVNMNEANRKSFVLGVEIKDGKIVDYCTKGFYISNEGILPYNIEEELNTISNAINCIQDVDKYLLLRKTEYSSVINSKFGTHNLSWLLSRFNYNSIGAKLLSVYHLKQYNRLFKQYLK